jgi:hypothetical protein
VPRGSMLNVRKTFSLSQESKKGASLIACQLQRAFGARHKNRRGTWRSMPRAFQADSEFQEARSDLQMMAPT